MFCIFGLRKRRKKGRKVERLEKDNIRIDLFVPHLPGCSPNLNMIIAPIDRKLATFHKHDIRGSRVLTADVSGGHLLWGHRKHSYT